ncbi:MAG: hypothetical protein LUD72_07120 [Bacteroidales bacterium]|nr:hypothetical protein [Bacteroidales bacterium]
MATQKTVNSDNLNVFKECMEAWVLEQLKDYETVESAASKYESILLNLDNLRESKQDKLTAGTGIEITSDNVVNVTIDNYPFIFVEELPTSGINENKVYCVPDEESTEENNIWIEYYYVNGKWEEFGKYTPKVDLSDYQKKLEYYSEGNRSAYVGGTESGDDECAYGRVEVDMMGGNVYMQTGSAHSIEHELGLTADGKLTLDNAKVLTEDNVVGGDNIDVKKNSAGDLEISAELSGYETTEAAQESHNSLAESLAELQAKVEALTGDTVSWQKSDEYLIALVDNEDNLLFAITKDAKVYIPVGLPDGIVGLKELLESYTPTGDYLTRELADTLYEGKLKYYMEDNQAAFTGGASDDGSRYARTRVDMSAGIVYLETGETSSAEHQLILDRDGSLQRDRNIVFDADTLRGGTNVNLSQASAGYYNISVDLSDYAKSDDIVNIEPYTEAEIRALFDD